MGRDGTPPPITRRGVAVIVRDMTVNTDKTTVGRAAYSLEEFAELFGRSRTWAYRRMYAGDIKVIRGMGQIMVPTPEIERLQSAASVAERRTRRGNKGGAE